MKKWIILCMALTLTLTISCFSRKLDNTKEKSQVENSSSPLYLEAKNAIERMDYNALEGLRDEKISSIVLPLKNLYFDTEDWDIRDAVVFLVQDIISDDTVSIMEDAINSPEVETRAIAICIIRNDYSLFDQFLVDGWLDEDIVDSAIEKYKNNL